MRHRLVVVGITGIKRAYLDIPTDEAIRRYCESEKDFADDVFDHHRVSEIEFDDEFGCYDAWSI